MFGLHKRHSNFQLNYLLLKLSIALNVIYFLIWIVVNVVNIFEDLIWNKNIYNSTSLHFCAGSGIKTLTFLKKSLQKTLIFANLDVIKKSLIILTTGCMLSEMKSYTLDQRTPCFKIFLTFSRSFGFISDKLNRIWKKC